MVPPTAWCEHGVTSERLPPDDAISTVDHTGVPVTDELWKGDLRAKFFQLLPKFAKRGLNRFRLVGVLGDCPANRGTHVLCCIL